MLIEIHMRVRNSVRGQVNIEKVDLTPSVSDRCGERRAMDKA